MNEGEISFPGRLDMFRDASLHPGGGSSKYGHIR